MVFSISFKQNFLKPNESCLLDRKKPNIAKVVYINFLAVSTKILRKTAVFCNSYKNTLIRVFLHAEFISALKPSQSLRFLRNMQKIEKKYLSLFSIFCGFLY